MDSNKDPNEKGVQDDPEHEEKYATIVETGREIGGKYDLAEAHHPASLPSMAQIHGHHHDFKPEEADLLKDEVSKTSKPGKDASEPQQLLSICSCDGEHGCLTDSSPKCTTMGKKLTQSLQALAGSLIPSEDDESEKTMNKSGPELKFPPKEEEPLASGQETPKLVLTSNLPSGCESKTCLGHDKLENDKHISLEACSSEGFDSSGVSYSSGHALGLKAEIPDVSKSLGSHPGLDEQDSGDETATANDNALRKMLHKIGKSPNMEREHREHLLISGKANKSASPCCKQLDPMAIAAARNAARQRHHHGGNHDDATSSVTHSDRQVQSTASVVPYQEQRGGRETSGHCTGPSTVSVNGSVSVVIVTNDNVGSDVQSRTFEVPRPTIEAVNKEGEDAEGISTDSFGAMSEMEEVTRQSHTAGVHHRRPRQHLSQRLAVSSSSSSRSLPGYKRSSAEIRQVPSKAALESEEEAKKGAHEGHVKHIEGGQDQLVMGDSQIQFDNGEGYGEWAGGQEKDKEVSGLRSAEQKLAQAGVKDYTQIPSKALRAVDSTERFSCDHNRARKTRSHVQFKMTDTLIEVDPDEFYGCEQSDEEDDGQKTRWPSRNPSFDSNYDEDEEDDDEDDDDATQDGVEKDRGDEPVGRVLVVEKDERTDEIKYRYCKKSDLVGQSKIIPKDEIALKEASMEKIAASSRSSGEMVLDRNGGSIQLHAVAKHEGETAMTVDINLSVAKDEDDDSCDSDSEDTWIVEDETTTINEALDLLDKNQQQAQDTEDMVVLNPRLHGNLTESGNDPMFRGLVNCGGPGATGVESAMSFLRQTSGEDGMVSSSSVEDQFSPTRSLLENPERLGCGGSSTCDQRLNAQQQTNQVNPLTLNNFHPQFGYQCPSQSSPQMPPSYYPYLVHPDYHHYNPHWHRDSHPLCRGFFVDSDPQSVFLPAAVMANNQRREAAGGLSGVERHPSASTSHGNQSSTSINWSSMDSRRQFSEMDYYHLSAAARNSVDSQACRNVMQDFQEMEARRRSLLGSNMAASSSSSSDTAAVLSNDDISTGAMDRTLCLSELSTGVSDKTSRTSANRRHKQTDDSHASTSTAGLETAKFVHSLTDDNEKGRSSGTQKQTATQRRKIAVDLKTAIHDSTSQESVSGMTTRTLGTPSSSVTTMSMTSRTATARTLPLERLGPTRREMKYHNKEGRENSSQKRSHGSSAGFVAEGDEQMSSEKKKQQKQSGGYRPKAKRSDSTVLLIENEEQAAGREPGTDHEDDDDELEPLPFWAVILLVIFFPVGICVWIYRNNVKAEREEAAKIRRKNETTRDGNPWACTPSRSNQRPLDHDPRSSPFMIPINDTTRHDQRMLSPSDVNSRRQEKPPKPRRLTLSDSLNNLRQKLANYTTIPSVVSSVSTHVGQEDRRLTPFSIWKRRTESGSVKRGRGKKFTPDRFSTTPSPTRTAPFQARTYSPNCGSYDIDFSDDNYSGDGARLLAPGSQWSSPLASRSPSMIIHEQEEIELPKLGAKSLGSRRSAGLLNEYGDQKVKFSSLDTDEDVKATLDEAYQMGDGAAGDGPDE